MMAALRIVGILFLALAAGCAGVRQAPPSVVAHPGPLIVDPSLLGPTRPAAKEETTVAIAPPPAPTKNQNATKAAPPPAKAPAKVAAAPPPVEQPRKNEDPPPAARKPEPSLDVAALKTRLRDTDGIGVFAKLALKNQVDDLLKQFRTHHQSGQKAGIASLRQPYDMLVLKVLALLQDSDPPLARTISGSREAIWAILVDPQKFNAIA